MRDGKYVILCVDDDQDILTALRLVLASAGYHVVTASNADQARAALQASQPDLLIVDLMMEEVDAGLTFVSSLRKEGVTTPAFFLSSAGDYLYGMADVGQLGADGVFQKPLSPDVLLSVIAGRLAQSAEAAAGGAVTSA